jgi:hypothetical protein
MTENNDLNKEDILEKVNSIFHQLNGDSLSGHLFEDNTKLISCRHEIIFNINANVLEENELGETVGSKAICTKNYHIPVPSDKDYNEYMDSFFSFLENCISQAAIKSNEETKTND